MQYIYHCILFIHASLHVHVHVHGIKVLLNLPPLVLKARHLVALPLAEIRFA